MSNKYVLRIKPHRYPGFFYICKDGSYIRDTYLTTKNFNKEILCAKRVVIKSVVCKLKNSRKRIRNKKHYYRTVRIQSVKYDTILNKLKMKEALE